ncbi:MAG: hypothetical protein M1142_04235 [Patescibacteria group bacterium]|nr:hypothetical protein [Patescibacteria group bacterium]
MSNKERILAEKVREKLQNGDPTYNENIFLELEMDEGVLEYPFLIADRADAWLREQNPRIPLSYREANLQLRQTYIMLTATLAADPKAKHLLSGIGNTSDSFFHSRTIITSRGLLLASQQKAENLNSFWMSLNTEVNENSTLCNVVCLTSTGSLSVSKFEKPDLTIPRQFNLPEEGDWKDKDQYQAFLYAQGLFKTYLTWDSLPQRMLRAFRTFTFLAGNLQFPS